MTGHKFIPEFEQEEFKKWTTGLKPSSLNNYRNAMKLYMSFTGLEPVQLIDEAELDFKRPRRERGIMKERLVGFYIWLTTVYKPSKGLNARKGRPGLSPYKARAIVGYLKTFYARNGFPLTSNIRLPSVAPKKENARVELSPRDVKHMVESASSGRDRALILFGYQGGFDADTVVRINLGDFSDKQVKDLLANKTPDTPLLLHVVREKEGIDFHTCLGYDAMDAFRQYIQLRKNMGEKLNLDSPAFRKEYTKGLTRLTRMNKILIAQMMRTVALKSGVMSKERLERCDINPAGYHALRSTFSRRLEYLGMPPPYIDYMQGHSLPHGGAYRKPSPRKLLDKYREFEEALSISQAPKTVTDLEEKFNKEIEKRDYIITGMEERINKVEEELKTLDQVKNLSAEIQEIKATIEGYELNRKI